MQYIVSLLLLILLTGFVLAQNVSKISTRCQSPYTGSTGSIQVGRDGTIYHQPCPTKSSIFEATPLRVYSGQFTSLIPNAVNYFSVSSPTPLILTNTSFVSSEWNWQLTASGTGRTFINQLGRLRIGGSFTNSAIYGSFNAVDFVGNTGGATNSATGVYGTVNGDTQFSTIYGGVFSAIHGSSAASGSDTVIGVQAAAGGAHNGTLTNAYGVEAIYSTSASSPSTTDNAYIIRSRVQHRPGTTVTNLRGLSFDTWTNDGTVTNNSVIYADTSVDIGTNRFFINSLSTSPSRLSGDIYISDNTKGIILRSPDNTCYRFTVANGGALNAGVLVTCPA